MCIRDRRNALDLARCLAVQIKQHLGALEGHHFIVHHIQRADWETHVCIALPDRFTFCSGAVSWVETPAAPLPDHTLWQVADRAQAPPRKVAKPPSRQWHQQPPEKKCLALERWCGLTPVAAASGN